MIRRLKFLLYRIFFFPSVILTHSKAGDPDKVTVLPQSSPPHGGTGVLRSPTDIRTIEPFTADTRFIILLTKIRIPDRNTATHRTMLTIK